MCRLACALLTALLAPAAQARDTMTWLMPDIPPASMPVDGKPTTGIADQILHRGGNH